MELLSSPVILFVWSLVIFTACRRMHTKSAINVSFAFKSVAFSLRLNLPISQISNFDVSGKLAIADNKNVNRLNRIDVNKYTNKTHTQYVNTQDTHTHNVRTAENQREKRETTKLCVRLFFFLSRYILLYLLFIFFCVCPVMWKSVEQRRLGHSDAGRKFIACVFTACLFSYSPIQELTICVYTQN